MHRMSSAPKTYDPDVERVRGWRSRLIPAVLLIVAATLVVFVAMMPNETPPLLPSDVPPVNVEVLRIQAVPELADTFDLTAVVEPDRVVKVAAEVTGRIERIGDRSQRAEGLSPRRDTGMDGPSLASRNPHGSKPTAHAATLQEGDPITEGAPIIYLNTDLLQAGFERAQAQFDFDQREYQRILGLFERDASAKSELDDARARRDISKATLDEASTRLERATIVAPIGGILNRLPMEVGEYAAPGDCVAEIVDTERVKVVVDVPEREVYYLTAGDAVDVFVRAPDARTIRGKITYISELAEELTRTTRMEITVENRDHILRSGQIARARLTRRILTNVIMIPLGAVIPLEHGRAVYVVDEDDRAQRKDVELGLIKGRNVRILSGLDVGERLIVAGHRYVGPGQPVAVVEEQ